MRNAIRFFLAVVIIAGLFKIITLSLAAEDRVVEAQRLHHCQKGYPGACK